MLQFSIQCMLMYNQFCLKSRCAAFRVVLEGDDVGFGTPVERSYIYSRDFSIYCFMKGVTKSAKVPLHSWHEDQYQSFSFGIFYFLTRACGPLVAMHTNFLKAPLINTVQLETPPYEPKLKLDTENNGRQLSQCFTLFNPCQSTRPSYNPR